MRICFLFIFTLLVCLPSAARSPSLNLNLDRVTVSGLSSGGYMATQFHFAHGDWVKGAAILAAGPMYCGQNDIKTALQQCVNQQVEPIPTHALNQQIRAWSKDGELAPLNELKDAKIWIFSGTEDTKVLPQISHALVKQYREFVDSRQIKVVANKPFAHHFPTVDSGTECDQSQPPFIGRCGYDAAGALLNHLLENLTAPSEEPQGQLISIDQKALGGETADSLADNGYLFVPEACANGSACSLHISFHGCNQNSEKVGDAYARQTGINRWADTNELVVLYPQTRTSMFMPLNPQGCWDWWGYTGSNYATRHAKQIKAVASIAHNLSSKQGTSL